MHGHLLLSELIFEFSLLLHIQIHINRYDRVTKWILDRFEMGIGSMFLLLELLQYFIQILFDWIRQVLQEDDQIVDPTQLLEQSLMPRPKVLTC